MRVIDAGQQVDAGRTRSAQFAAVAAPCCCTWLATLTIQCQPHWRLTGYGRMAPDVGSWLWGCDWSGGPWWVACGRQWKTSVPATMSTWVPAATAPIVLRHDLRT